MRRPWVIYVITEIDSTKPCKIGKTRWIDSRRRLLQTGNPRRLEVRCAHEYRNGGNERGVHAILKAHKIRGEWFDIDWDEASEIIEKYFDDMRPSILEIVKEAECFT